MNKLLKSVVRRNARMVRNEAKIRKMEMESRLRDLEDTVREMRHEAENRRHEGEVRRLERKLSRKRLPVNLFFAIFYNLLAMVNFLTGSRKKRWTAHTTGFLLLLISAFHFILDFAERRAEDL